MSAQEYRRIIAVDFDGTLAVTKFPQIIKPIWKTIALCKYLQKRGAILILWTCRCGDDLTEPQIEEAATMRCECEKALEYQESANRRTAAKQRVNELFGEGAGEYKQPDAVQTIILNTVDAICDKKMKAAVVTIRTGLRCRIMQMAKDKIKVVREISDNNEFVQ